MKRMLIILLSAVLLTVLIWSGESSIAGGESAPSGKQGKCYERLPCGGIGPKIPNVRITFLEKDGNHAYSIFANEYGGYRIDLPIGKYYTTATHPDFYPYVSYPGLSVVTGGGYQTCNFFLTRK